MANDTLCQDWISELPEPLRSEVVDCMTQRQFHNGDLIYRTGDVGNEILQVTQGNVRMFTISESGRELVYDLFPAGTCFGESSLIDGGPRPHTAQAVGRVTLRALARADFERLWSESPVFSRAVARLVSHRTRRLYGIYEQVSHIALSRRMAARLCGLAATAGEQRDDGVHFNLRITQEDIGSLVAGSRQSVNKILRQWQADEIIDLAYGSLIIRDLPTLERLSQKGD
ncbi:Crp/Fnr family transcriptional regulator [Parahaliea mediterranea]|uniref:Crp/Fnr family transcriptional regulator n=1 Tax=Parahaliea mediterranea TaxID=651086 RepID=UPI000E2F8705|nr:Crp/Fnr family transcriptional regulator [Parahaliea mediterranea]